MATFDMKDETLTDSEGGLRTHAVFRHALVEKAEHYRAILGVFVRSREQFITHLRPAEVACWIDSNEDETENALRMLRQWGNLEATQDSAEATTLEEIYRSRFLYALSAEGEAAERALLSLRKPCISRVSYRQQRCGISATFWRRSASCWKPPSWMRPNCTRNC